MNIMGTRAVQDNLQEATDHDREIILSKNLADKYWAREDDENYKKACQEWEDMVETRRENPKLVSLYKFASKYTQGWKMRKEAKVPHFTPNFNRIPNKKGKPERYAMFLRTMLLSHKPGTTFAEVHGMNTDTLEAECSNFCDSPLCPKLVKEEFQESQIEEWYCCKKQNG